MSITLAEDAQQLDEVVVTAFGTGQKKETITGSIQSVRPSDLLVPSANLSSSFAGRLSGVIAYQRSENRDRILRTFSFVVLRP